MLIPILLPLMLLVSDGQGKASVRSSPQVKSPPAAAAQNRAAFFRQQVLNTALTNAVRTANLAQVKALLAKGAHANGSDGWSERPLFTLEGTDAQRLAIARVLIAHGASVNALDAQGMPLLVNAVTLRWSLPLIRFLITKGTKVNAADRTGHTALYMAVRMGDGAVINLLLASGASVKARTHEETPLRRPSVPPELSVMEADGDEVDRVGDQMRRQNERMYSRLYEPGYQPTGETPLFALVGHWNPETYDALVKAGADPMATDDNGWTLLHHATKLGDPALLRALLQRGFDPNAGTKRGNRPLHLIQGPNLGLPNSEAAKTLREGGADPTLRNHDGQTPLETLRAEAATTLARWQLDPNTDRAEWIAYYRDEADRTARVLDPGAEPIPIPPPFVDERGRRYRSLNLGFPPSDEGEPEGFAAERAVRVEDGKVILQLRFVRAPAALTFTISELELSNYEPLVPLPIQVKVPQGGEAATILIPFPSGAATSGALQMKYRTEPSSRSGGDVQVGSGGGEINEGATTNLTFSSDPTTGQVMVSHELKGRTVVMRIESATSGGKAVPALAGRELTIESGSGTVIPGLKGGVKFSLKYKIRALPNKRWREGSLQI